MKVRVLPHCSVVTRDKALQYDLRIVTRLKWDEEVHALDCTLRDGPADYKDGIMNENLGEITYRYTPDSGKVEGPVNCGVCGSEMEVTRNCTGPRSFVEAMLKDPDVSRVPHDVFCCPHSREDWHKQVVAILRQAKETPSSRLESLLRTEAEEILISRKATKLVSNF
jgi:hypothetical protein